MKYIEEVTERLLERLGVDSEPTLMNHLLEQFSNMLKVWATKSIQGGLFKPITIT